MPKAARPVTGTLARGPALAALAGAAAAAGQAPLGLWPVTLLALGLVTWLVAIAPARRRRIVTGWAAGSGYFAATLFWIVEPFMVEAARDGWMAPFALVFMAVGMALFWALAAFVAGLGRSPAARALAFATGLAATDLLRSYVLTGFPWVLLGHVWIGTPVMQAAAVIGPIGLTLVTVFAAALPVARHLAGRPVLPVLALVIASLAGLWALGALRLAAPEPLRDPPIRVRLVQPNATQSLKWQEGMWQVFLDRLIAATAAPREKPLDLIVWPETAVPFLFEQSAGFFAGEVAAAAQGVPVATGIERLDDRRYYNSLVAVDGQGTPIAVYDKWHLVPFGEYIPLGDFALRFGISAFAAQSGAGFSAGPGAQVLDLGRAGKVLPLICYEAVFPQDLNAAPVRADWILQITNDGWFGALSGPWQHLAQARLRAVEQGLPFLRSANTGVTAVIDAKGRVLRTLALDTEGWFDTDVPAALPPTIYARTGDLPATILISFGLLAFAFRRRRQGD